MNKILLIVVNVIKVLKDCKILHYVSVKKDIMIKVDNYMTVKNVPYNANHVVLKKIV